MFATDYPHHQFDDPAHAAPAGLSADAMARFLGGNALATYRPGGDVRCPLTSSSTATSTTSSPPAPCTRTCRRAGAPTTRPTATAVTAAFAYPKGAPRAARADAWPPSGLPPGADLGFLREQHLDPYDVRYGVLNCLTAACRAAEPRLRGGAVPRGQRVAGRGVAGEGAAAASGHRRPLRGRRTGRRGDRPGRRAPGLRAGAAARPHRRAVGPQARIGRSSRPPCATGCRSGSTSAVAAAATRSRRRAGPRSTSRTTRRWRRRSRRRSSAWSSRASSRSSRRCGWC